ncbi:bifunctional biotin--[acetyl-CoA-carboxylase] ligase/biotin operon repressor BirA [Paraglaciecola aquimarina]|uniref:Bifunctional ligase/repressor BirA n=1 Tax=Paraglaciecola aquimarina TaxID=1235557 RepID=A0ABU3SSX7_9ALTE|nr:bifunctional biotin--[acetyl-CoA-carboxylase] ligase/biotin operon repressor BirA [Paraglaciecola aquimarina]MDU0353077.1 bifunctional biotin--[acetyl-CoA-carboxylase] ligase/biotin operon repressor BirA [Paraglaciecola aquimarina]
MKNNLGHIRSSLLATLADGKFHSGEALGESLGISRSAISNHVKTLADLGLDIYSVTGKGYRLAQPLSMLEPVVISKHLSCMNIANVEVLNVIDSTNQYIKNKSGDLVNGHVCLAEAQTAGRGRHGREWVSPYGASLYLSMHWHFTGGYTVLAGLSLAIGVAVANTLKLCGIDDARLKWPNDIYAQGKKLAGVLIEVEGQIGSGCDCVIGIGLNVALPNNVKNIDQPWIDLMQISETPIDRNQLAGYLIDELHASLLLFEQDGLKPFVEQWKQLDVYANRAIRLIMGQKTIEGIGRGIDTNGALLLETQSGLQSFHGGEISVRAK